MRMRSFCMRTHTGELGLETHPKDFCRVYTEFGSSFRQQGVTEFPASLSAQTQFWADQQSWFLDNVIYIINMYM